MSENGAITKVVDTEVTKDGEVPMLRLAIEKGAPIETIERVLAMMKEERAYQAEKEFNEALNKAQIEMQIVAPDKHNDQTNSDWASYAALDKMVRPIYTKHGFSLSFDEEDSPKPDHVRVVAFLSRAGHTRKYRKDVCADGKGAKGGDVMTRTHAAAAADSYGMRYLMKMLFNIAIGEEDDDGNLSLGNVADWLTLIKEAKTIAELKEQYGKAVADALLPDKAPKASGKAIEFYKEAGKKRKAELLTKSEKEGPL